LNTYSEQTRGLFQAKLIGVIAGMLTTVAIYYIYNGAVGKSPDLLNIISFFIGVGAAYFASYTRLKTKRKPPKQAK
jgi:hypothetical protein